jgi:hypothetical protein
MMGILRLLGKSRALPPMPQQARPRRTPSRSRVSARRIGENAIGPLVAVPIDCGFQLKAYLLAPQWHAMELGPDAPVVPEVAPNAIHLMRE